jgi:hypothetical protein
MSPVKKKISLLLACMILPFLAGFAVFRFVERPPSPEIEHYQVKKEEKKWSQWAVQSHLPIVKLTITDNGTTVVVPPGWGLYIEIEAEWYQVLRYEKVPDGIQELRVENISPGGQEQRVGVLYEVKSPGMEVGVLDFFYKFQGHGCRYTIKINRS